MLGLLAAFQFLTLLPISRGFTSEQIGRSTAYFPVVGIVIGLILAGINYVLSLILPSTVVNILLITALAVFSGALHLDGLADTLDGIAGHRTAEERLKIMRDSRIGGFGAIGMALFLLIEYVLLNSIPDNMKLYVLILAPTVSRWAMVNAIFVYPYARASGLGTSFKESVNWQQFVAATLVTLIVAGVLFRIAGIAIMAFAWIIITLVANYLKRQLGGLTGDTYGAINEVAVLSVFLMVTMLAFKHWLI
jgi:adenosylcobinamide-GDP ribazoletransferase